MQPVGLVRMLYIVFDSKEGERVTSLQKQEWRRLDDKSV